MLMEGNVVLIYFASFLLGLERYSRTSAILVAGIFMGAAVAAYGEINFSLFGLFVQLGSQVFEVTKVLTQNVLMSSKGQKLDPLTMVLFMAPVSFVLISIFFIACHYDQLEQVYLATWRMWPYLL